MNRATKLALCALAFVCAEIVPSENGAFAQQRSIREQLVGTWTLVATENVHADGSKVDELGPNPKGILIFDETGRYSVTLMRSDLPRIAAGKADRGTAQENQAIVAGLVTHFGTYGVDEAGKVLVSRIEASSFPNNNGIEQRRIVVSLTADEFRYALPTTVTGTRAEVSWRRVR